MNCGVVLVAVLSSTLTTGGSDTNEKCHNKFENNALVLGICKRHHEDAHVGSVGFSNILILNKNDYSILQL